MSPPAFPIHAKITGPIVMIGFGSIGKGTLPLIERHLTYDKSRITVLDPKDEGRKALCEKHGVRFIQQGLTRENYRALLTPLLTEGGGQGFCVNLSVDTGSVDIMELCRELGVLYIDTVNEPWLGFYFDKNKGPSQRSNYDGKGIGRTIRKDRPARNEVTIPEGMDGVVDVPHLPIELSLLMKNVVLQHHPVTQPVRQVCARLGGAVVFYPWCRQGLAEMRRDIGKPPLLVALAFDSFFQVELLLTVCAAASPQFAGF